MRIIRFSYIDTVQKYNMKCHHLETMHDDCCAYGAIVANDAIK